MVVTDGEMHVNILGQEPIVATRGAIVNILRTTLYSYETAGDKPTLWVEISPRNFKTVYPAVNEARDKPAPPAPAGAEMVKVAFASTPPAYATPNIPYWNLFE